MALNKHYIKCDHKAVRLQPDKPKNVHLILASEGTGIVNGYIFFICQRDQVIKLKFMLK